VGIHTDLGRIVAPLIKYLVVYVSSVGHYLQVAQGHALQVAQGSGFEGFVSTKKGSSRSP
jgi:hypothetical protein